MLSAQTWFSLTETSALSCPTCAKKEKLSLQQSHWKLSILCRFNIKKSYKPRILFSKLCHALRTTFPIESAVSEFSFHVCASCKIWKKHSNICVALFSLLSPGHQKDLSQSQPRRTKSKWWTPFQLCNLLLKPLQLFFNCKLWSWKTVKAS